MRQILYLLLHNYYALIQLYTNVKIKQTNMNRKELEPYVSHDVKGLFNLLAKKRTTKLSKSTLREKILKVINDNESSDIQYAQFKRIYEELAHNDF